MNTCFTHIPRFFLLMLLGLCYITVASGGTLYIYKTSGTPIVIPAYNDGDVFSISGGYYNVKLDAGDLARLNEAGRDGKRYKIEIDSNCWPTAGIPDNTFSGNQLLQSFISHLYSGSSGVGIIGKKAFYNCPALEIFVCPATSISDSAFTQCRLLENVRSEYAETIGIGAFDGCASLGTFDFNKVHTIGAMAFYNCVTLGSFSQNTSAHNLKHIGAKAFAGCESLTTAESFNPEGILSLGAEAFSGCTELYTGIDFLLISTIEDKTFYGCVNLNTINIPEATSIGNFAFKGCKGWRLYTISFPKVISIGEGAFEDCSVIVDINFPKLKVVGNGAFKNCIRLSGIIFPEATNIGSSAFEGCTTMTGVSLPQIETISSSAFRNCVSLLGISIPKAKSIENKTFELCGQLRFIELGANPPSVVTSGNNASFSGVIRSLQLLVPDANQYTNLDAYPGVSTARQAALRIVERKTPLVMPTECNDGDVVLITVGGDKIYSGTNNLEAADWLQLKNFALAKYHLVSAGIPIPEGQFENNEYLLSITLSRNETQSSKTLYAVGKNAFRNCTSLSRADIPSTYEIGNYAFAGCTSLSELIVSEAWTIGAYAFSECASLVDVIFGQPVTDKFGSTYLRQLGDGAFRNCTALQNVMFNVRLPEIGTNCFEGINHPLNILLSHITNPDISKFPSGSKTYPGIGKISGTLMSMPEYNKGDMIWVIGDKLETYDWKEFSSPATGFRLTLSQTAQDIPNRAFQYNTSISSIKGDEIEEVGRMAFNGCSSLLSVDFRKITSVQPMTFTGCTQLNNITLPEAVDIGSYAFDNCKALNFASLPKAVTIGESAFSGCLSLTSFSLPVVTHIGSRAWDVCTKLISADLPGVRILGDRAFFGCTALTAANFYGMTAFGLQVFDGGCISLKSITVNLSNSNYATLDGVLYNKALTQVIFYPAGKRLNGYFAPETVVSVATSAFLGCPHLTSVSFIALQGIETEAFNNCTRLLFMELGNTPPTVAANSFVGMTTPLQLLVSDTTLYDDSYMMQYPGNSIVLAKVVPLYDPEMNVGIQGAIDSVGTTKSIMARPVAYATIILYGKTKTTNKSVNEEDPRSGYPYLAAMTQADGDGNFSFEVPRGEYLLWIEMPGYTVSNSLTIGTEDTETSLYRINFSLDEYNQRIVGDFNSGEPGPTSVSEQYAVKATLYPNPATDGTLRITIESNLTCDIRIYNSVGQLMKVISRVTEETTVDVNSWNAGIYFVRITSQGKESSYKIVKN